MEHDFFLRVSRKLARLVDLFGRRLQVQERLTQQIASELQRVLKPKGVAVMIEGKHQSMCCRGVRKQNGENSYQLSAWRILREPR